MSAANTPTPHNAAKYGEIAKTVLMPGDPLRAKFVAETFLTDVHQFTGIRNMYGFTGKYNGKEVSVMGSGMGVPSIGLYSYELYNFYDVDNIIRIGTTGAIQESLDLGDLVIAEGACTDSNFASHFELPGTYAPIASFHLLRKAVEAAEKLEIPYAVGNVVTSDVFYNETLERTNKWKRMGVLCVEMETAGLYMNAAQAHKSALSMLTVSDCPFKGTETAPEEREKSFVNMIKVALETA